MLRLLRRPRGCPKIIERVSGRELPTDWFPWQPLDSKGSLDGVNVTGYEYPHVHWTDAHGVDGRSNIEQGEGKLPWRLDWPANGASTPSPVSPSEKTTGQRRLVRHREGNRPPLWP